MKEEILINRKYNLRLSRQRLSSTSVILAAENLLVFKGPVPSGAGAGERRVLLREAGSGQDWEPTG